MRTTDQTTNTLPAHRQAALQRQVADQHIVDALIAERGKLVMASPWWPFIKPFAYRILRYRSAVDMADTIAQMEAVDVFARLSDILTLNVTTKGLDRVPTEGPVVLVSNHPTGIADGIVL
ncbi:MAG: acyltransferase, partial [Rhodobacteraceae bacterium]|nr:acyltransferase [Paracoccaceae bacterium]